ncbi:hypothetical protein V1639_00825 [Pseudarthrobacter sp. J75]|uniref:hypothetical protein n=1 Tax=unclassified Pseudarthrobacter TaxID=2647000 RepID=UPI002E81FEE0|nr:MULTISPECIES: hypothetical protein [unclassified Pseudarthrobacter]MEE2527572.1 hypothetical protein [Pseudarthrobacter sp. J75]MEE2570675.1 hypothetical protein [Pseudarthrobacter sp. J64]
MREFRDEGFRQLPGLGAWWGEFETVSPALSVLAAKRPEVYDALHGLLRDAGTWLSEPDSRIDRGARERLSAVLDAVEEDASSHTLRVVRQARRLADRLADATFAEALELTAQTKPVGRKPRKRDPEPEQAVLQAE